MLHHNFLFISSHDLNKCTARLCFFSCCREGCIAHTTTGVLLHCGPLVIHEIKVAVYMQISVFMILLRMHFHFSRWLIEVLIDRMSNGR